MCSTSAGVSLPEQVAECQRLTDPGEADVNQRQSCLHAQWTAAPPPPHTGRQVGGSIRRAWPHFPFIAIPCAGDKTDQTKQGHCFKTKTSHKSIWSSISICK